ncbi:MFS transporter [Brevibacillus centrosporus]|uniref:MFS transporter n=1 Tax=Brevibacillus centrosporus TaxID=54910 RepID=UPI003985F5A2
MKQNAPGNSKWLIFTLSFIVLLAVMNALLFNVALADISADLSIGPSQVSWILIGYSMIIAIGSMTYGKLADHFSVKRLLLFALGLFIIGSLVGFSKPSYTVIILGRIIQASGGSAFISLAMVTVVRIIQPDRRPAALAMISAAIALAAGVGPLVGGVITNAFGWPYLFLLMVIAVVGIGLVLAVVPKDAGSSSPFHFDFWGAGLLFGVIASILLAVTSNKLLFLLAITLAVLLKGWLAKARHPFIDTELFANKTFLRVSSVGFLINVGIMANAFLFPLLLSHKNGLSPFYIGMLMFIGGSSGILSSFTAGKLLPVFGGQRVIYLAAVTMIAGFLMLGLLPQSNVFAATIALVLIAMSYSAIQVSLNNLIPQTLRPEKLGVGLGFYNLLNFVGMAFGPAVASRILESTNSYSLIYIGAAILVSLPFVLLQKPSTVQQKAA